MALVITRLSNDGENEYERIGRVVDGKVSDESLLDIYPERVWAKKSEEWIAARLDGPRVFAGIVEDESVEPVGEE